LKKLSFPRHKLQISGFDPATGQPVSDFKLADGLITFTPDAGTESGKPKDRLLLIGAAKP
jgi:hypothetical protein